MATFNLVRNSRVFVTTNVVAGTGVVKSTGFTALNTQELQVLDGFSFSQATNADTVQIKEAGGIPVRGQRSFNTSLGEVQFSFSTYIKPYVSTTVKAEESVLWNALLGSQPITASDVPTTGYTFSYSTGVLTITGSSVPVIVGEVVVIKGVTGVGASQFNMPAKVTAVTNSTSVQLTYLTQPQATWVTGNFSASAVKLSRTAWNEFPAITLDTAATTGGGIPSLYSSVTTGLSNKNQLVAFGVLSVVDGVTYQIDNAAMDQAVVDFGLDAIAMVAWTGKGTKLTQMSANITTPTSGTFATGITGTYAPKVINNNFITNKLSTVTLVSNIGGLAGTEYTLALTGGSLTIANGITYVTPANLGVVNIPVGYFTGTRAISGSLTAYLRTGTLNTAGLLSTLLDASATVAGVEPKFTLQIEVGGAANATRVELEIPGAMLQIPTIDAQAVMSTSIAFTAQGYSANMSTNTYDIENTNELEVRYFSA